MDYCNAGERSRSLSVALRSTVAFAGVLSGRNPTAVDALSVGADDQRFVQLSSSLAAARFDGHNVRWGASWTKQLSLEAQ